MKFCDVLEIKNGKNQSSVESPDGQYPIYGSGGIIGRADSYICEAETVIIGRKGTINRPIYVETPFWNVDTAFGLIANREKLLPKYLYYFCEHFNFEVLSTTVTIPSLTKANLLNIEVTLPTLEIQTKVVKVLDRISGLMLVRNKQLSMLEELVKSRFVEMFGDPILNSKGIPSKQLQDVLNLKAGDFTAADSIEKTRSKATPYPCYGGNGIRGYVSEFNQDGTYSLIGRQGALSGNVQFVSGKFKNTEHALLVTPLIEFDAIWLHHLLKNMKLERYQTGAAQPGLSIKNLAEVSVIIPPLERQNQFAAFVAQADRSKLEIQKSLEKLETLKKALMQKYFG